MSSPTDFIARPSTIDPSASSASEGTLAPLGRPVAVGLLLVLVLAAVLRFTALGFGAGVMEARPDEMGVALALRGMRTGQPFPMFFAYGGGYHTPLYAFVGSWERLFWNDDLVTMVARDPQRVFVAARAWSAILSTATVLLTFAIGRRLGGGATGLLAAASAFAKCASRTASGDTASNAAASFVAASAFFVLADRSRSLTSRAVRIGLVAGLALGTKYLVGFAFVLMLDLGRELRWSLRDGRWRYAASAGALALAVFLLLAPTWITDPKQSAAFTRAVVASQQNFPVQAFFSGWVGGPLEYHATVSLRTGTGLLFALLTLPALLCALRRPGASRMIAVAILAHGLVLAANPLVVARNLLPALSGLAVLVADLVHRALQRASAPRRRLAAAMALVGVILVAEPIVAAIRLVNLLGRQDTRAAASQWIDDNLPPNARIATWGAPAGAADFGAPTLTGRRAARGAAPAQWRQLGITHLVRHSYPLPYSSAPLPADWPEMRRVAAFDPFDGPMRSPVLEPLDAFYLPLGGLDGVAQPGPLIEIFELPGDAR